MIEIKNLAKRFDGNLVLNDISFTINDDSIIGLMGESGEGKTTLANILAGLEKATDGEIYFDGEPLFRNGIKKNRQNKIQIVYQESFESLDPKQTIYQSIRELVKYFKLSNYIDEFIKEKLKEMELEESILFKYPNQISGGEAKRIVLLKALLLKPRLIVFDETFVNLDNLTRAFILKLILKKKEELEFSILFISHDLLLTKELCDKIYILKNGRIKENESF